jgi:hypothetical protein
MPEPIYVLCSETVKMEMARVIEGKGDVFAMVAFTSRCTRPAMTLSAIKARCKPPIPENASCVVVGGPCLNLLPRGDADSTDRVHCFANCFELILGGSLVQGLAERGAHLVTPGWLARWEEHLAGWGFDQATARLFFQESVNKIVLADTYVDPGSHARLHAFADYIGLPSEVLPIGLDVMKLWLKQVEQEWRFSREREDTLKQFATAMRESADSAMIMDLMGRLAATGTMAETARTFMELLSILFAPGRIRLLTLREGQPAEGYTQPFETMEEEYCAALLDFGSTSQDLEFATDGFRMRIKHQGKLMAIVEVSEVLFPEYLGRYKDTALNTGKIAGVALANAVTYRELQHTVEELSDALANVKTLTGLLPVCAYCKRIRDDQGYWDTLEAYLEKQTDIQLSHGICKECAKEHFPRVNLDDE